MVWFQDSISERLHYHTLSNIFSDGISEAHYAQILSCSNLGVGVWLIVRPIFPSFKLIFPVLSTMFWIQLGLAHPSILSILQCVCTHPTDPMNIHLLCCVHGNGCTKTHDAIHDTFVAIAQNVGFHMGQKSLHALPLNMFNSSHWWVDIVLTKDGIHTLVKVVIADLT
jgi:hypothetical protein